MVIWTNILDFDDWKQDLIEEYPDYTDSQLEDIMYETNNDCLENEKAFLSYELGHPIVVLGNLGLWDGRRTGYKFIRGTNLNDCFSGTVGDYITWYTEDGDLKCKDIHHDGTNYYTYRAVTIPQHEFEEYVYEHSFKEAVNKYTEKLGRFVERFYGVTA